MVDLDQNNRISVTRGDSFTRPLFLNQGTELSPVRYILTEGDTIYLSIMEWNAPFEEGIVKKVYTIDNLNENGDVLIKINHEDTKDLLPGKYFYQIKAKFNNGDVNTVVQKTEFFIEE